MFIVTERLEILNIKITTDIIYWESDINILLTPSGSYLV